MSFANIFPQNMVFHFLAIVFHRVDIFNFNEV